MCVYVAVLYAFTSVLCTTQFKLGNLDAKRDWGHAKDFVEVRHCVCMYICISLFYHF